MEATTTTDDDAPGKKQTTATPKSNADFRNFLLSNGRNDEEKNFAKNNTTTTTTKEEKDLPDVGAFPNRKKKKKKKANQLQETTTKTRRDENNTHRYRDRAKERREMEEEDQDDDDGDEGRRADNQRDKSNTFATTTRGGVFEHAFEDEDRLTTKTTTINTNSKRLMDIEKSKYMGGDEKTTHKVKGLDFALLRKKREELFEMKKENIEEGDDDDEEEEVVVVEDEDDANNNNPSSSGYSSLYDAKSNLGRILVSKIETAQKRNKDALTKRTKIPPLSGVSYLYDVNSRTREVTRTIEMETKPRADIEEERKARRREFAKISKDEEKILRAVAKAIREPRGTKEEEKKNSHNIATDNSNASAEGKKIDTNNAAADSDSEDIFADVGKDYDAIAELKKEEEQNGKKEATTTAAKKESRTKLFDGEALLEEFETGPRKADENIKKMDEAYERKRLEERAEMDDDAYGEYYPGFDAGFGGEIDDDDDDGDTDRDKDKDKDTGEEEKGKKGKKKKELTEAQKMKQKENEAYQAMQKHMKEKYSDKYDAAFGVVKKKEDNENNEAEDTKTEEEKEGVAGGKRAKRLKI